MVFIYLLSWGVLANTQLNQIVFTAPRPDNFDRIFPAYSGPGIHQFFAQCATYMHSETHKLLCQPLYGDVRIDFVLEPNIGSHQSFGITQRMNCKVTVDGSTLHLGCAEANIVEGQSSIAVEILRNPIVPSSDYGKKKRAPNKRSVSKTKHYSVDLHQSSSPYFSKSYSFEGVSPHQVSKPSIQRTNQMAMNRNLNDANAGGTIHFSSFSRNPYFENRIVSNIEDRIKSNWERTKMALDIEFVFGEVFYFDDILGSHGLRRFMDVIHMPTSFQSTKLSKTSARFTSKGMNIESRLFICQYINDTTDAQSNAPNHIDNDAVFCFSDSKDGGTITSRFRFNYCPKWVFDGFSFWCKAKFASGSMRTVSTECLSFDVNSDDSRVTTIQNNDNQDPWLTQEWDLEHDTDFKESFGFLDK